MCYKSAAIVLNYNSLVDTQSAVLQLYAQNGGDLFIIIVDNASEPDCVSELVGWVKEIDEHSIVGTSEYVDAHITNTWNEFTNTKRHALALVLNSKNAGYSAGNNIGIRLASHLSADYILIANPDVLFLNNNAIVELALSLKENPTAALAGPVIIGPRDEIQSPMFEPSFLQEIVFPFLKPWASFLTGRYISRSLEHSAPTPVHKLHGCCFMIRKDFLDEAGLLDENIFMYCEEAALAQKARNYGYTPLLVPTVQVRHLHEKGGGNFLLYSASRLYFLRTYKKYGNAKIFAIALIHKLINLKRQHKLNN